jgi:holliday junction DNA helicase RuvA
MIAYIEGQVKSVAENSAVVITGGLGYRVYVLPSTLFTTKVGEEVNFYTHQYVREDALELYGFQRPEELKMFETLIGITGIGPRTAMGILAITTPEQLKTAVVSGSVALLTKVSGIGKKTAERLIVELKDTFQVEEKKHGAQAGSLYESDLEIIEALERLGYSSQEARRAIEALPKDVTGTEQRLKAVLKNLGSGKK